VFNGTAPMLDAALAYMPEDTARPHLASGRLIRLLADCARHTRAITSTISAAANPRLPSHCLSTRMKSYVLGGILALCIVGCPAGHRLTRRISAAKHILS
jgi:hypothetical protein